MAEEGDSIVGVTGATTRTVRMRGEDLPAADLGDLFVHPDHRGRGLFRELHDALLDTLRYQKRLADRAIAQLTSAQLHEAPHEDGNSVVIQMKHLGGNMRSRWTRFLTTDGEKPDRNRDGEFIDDFQSREELDAWWEGGWRCLFEAIESLKAEDLERSVTIRGEPHGVVEAVLRQVNHYGYHVGQIVQQARALAGPAWRSRSIPRGESGAYNRSLGHATS